MKHPSNTPIVGDRVRLRGRQSVGKLIHLNKDNNWTLVDWGRDGALPGPRICHLFELEVMPEDVP